MEGKILKPAAEAADRAAQQRDMEKKPRQQDMCSDTSLTLVGLYFKLPYYKLRDVSGKKIGRWKMNNAVLNRNISWKWGINE